MDLVEQENQSLREEVATLREGMDRLTTMMSALLSAQNSQAAAAAVEQPLVSTTPLSTVTSPPLFLPPGCTWGMPPPVCGSPQPAVSEVPLPFAQQSAPVPQPGTSFPQAAMTYSAPLIHTIQQEVEPIYQAENVVAFDKMEELQERFDDRDQLHAMTQKEKETFKEYAQRWREVAAQIVPPLEEREMTKIFLKTLSQFYYEKMVASAPTDFTEMVNMGVRLEEDVREGRLTVESTPAASNAKKFGGHFAKKKDQEVGMVAHGKPQQNFTPYRQVANVASTIPNPSYHQQRPHYPYQYPPQQYHPQQYPPQQYHQPQYPQKQQNRPQTPQQPYHSQNRQKTTFDPIPMKYADLLPALLAKNLVQFRAPPRTPDVLPPWFRHDLTCAFHQGAPGHDVENCYILKNEVQKLVRANLLSFKDQNPNVQANPLPNHGPAVNMIQDCDEDGVILNVQHVRTPLVPIHIKMCEAALFDHDHAACEVCPVNVKGCPKVKEDIQGLIDSRELIITRKDKEVCVITPEFQRLEISYNSGESTTTPLVISLPGPMSYASLKVVPYKYSATMLEGSSKNSVGSNSITSTFCSARFINDSPEANAVLEDVPEEIVLAFVTPGKLVRNWDAVDIPSVVHASK
ncbi:hypothetical protein HKD37_10G027826 [Glycine soja]